jgi:hypothetical protein
MTADELRAMTDTERWIYVAKQREHAQKDAEFQRASIEYRNRMVTEWDSPAVETREERWRREDEERKTQHEAERIAEKIERTTELREAREHELRMTKAWADAANNGNGNGGAVDNDIAEVFGALSDALNSIVNRLESVEQRLSVVEGTSESAARRLDGIQTRAEAVALQTKSELRADIHALKSDVANVAVRLDVMASRKQPQPQQQHIILHDDR